MIYKKNELNLKKGINKEWIITNGIGGYSSGTIIGINTRKYHGLLVAPLNPPAKRFLILSKVDESIEVDRKKYDLSSNMCNDYVSEGYKYLVKFEKDYIPVFRYQLKGIKIEKSICMEHGKNTVVVLYRILSEKDAKFTVAPLINFRDFHTINSSHKFQLEQDIDGSKVKIIVDGENKTPVYINLSDGRYVEHENDRFNNMFYKEEANRGFYPEENHAVPGRYEVLIKSGKEKIITFACSLSPDVENINGQEIIKNEIHRIDTQIKEVSEVLKNESINNQKLNSESISSNEKRNNQKLNSESINNENIHNENINNANINNEKINSEKINNEKSINEKAIKENINQELVKKYVIASDNFIVYRPSFRLHTLIAGYPWFLDWGRDSLISLEGIALISGRYQIAKEILLTLVKGEEGGLIPNGYSGFDSRPLYNSVDSSLLLFEQVKKFLNYTQDYKFIKSKIYPTLLKIIVSYKKGIDIDNNNIIVDKDNLVSSGTKQTQNTWMDAKIGQKAVTPRNGKAVEINAMWYNALKIAEELCIEFDNPDFAKKCSNIAKKCKKSFEEQFYNPEKQCLFDVIGDDKIRPNQLFALGLSYPVIEISDSKAKEIFNLVTKKLLNDYGLKTLAKGEDKYVEVYEGDETKRDMSYHQGITWPWLLGIYVDVYKKIISFEKDEKNKKILIDSYNKLKSRIYNNFVYELEKGKSVGNISEIYDSKKPFESKGAFAQCWSVAEVFRILFSKD